MAGGRAFDLRPGLSHNSGMLGLSYSIIHLRGSLESSLAGSPPNWSAWNAALRKRGSLLIWLDRETARLAPRDGRPDRLPAFSDAAIRFRLSIKGEGRPKESTANWSQP